ncbi:UNVERIFIED_CONTAM: putative leucine-rich repeat receptor-like serine/threonine-protein kinase, partial [Sesamum indicum]
DLTRNYLNGTIPPEWGSMKLVNIRISDNNFVGSIPGFIQNWTNIEKLDLSFNKLSGPIPDSFVGLSNTDYIGIVSCLRSFRCERNLKGLDLHTGSFTLRQIRAATNNFDPANKIGEGGFGPVYKANSLKEKGNLMELVDPRLESNFNREEVMMAINVALLCTNTVAAERPTMSAVVSMLEGRAGVQEFVLDSNDNMKHKETATTGHDGQGQSISMDVPWTASSASTADLYPITVDTDYWEKRDQ